MQKTTLEFLFTINGIGSASGLIFKNNFLYIIGDNSGFLYEYNIDTPHLKQHPLIENPTANIPKKDKPDFEAITQFEDQLYIFGSGSTEKRNKMIQVDTQTKKVITTTDLMHLYQFMQSFGKIKAEDFNIEAVIFNGENWFLFNRGNSNSNKNIVFTIPGKNVTNEFNILSNAYKLPQIKAVHTSFTDAILVDNGIYFLASAEDTISTYDDGEVLGSIIGCIDIQTMKINFTNKISDTHKFEGLTLFKNSKETLEFLLCEDKDTEDLEADIYKLVLKKT